MRITFSRDHEAKADDLLDLLTTSNGLDHLPPDIVGQPTISNGPAGDAEVTVSWSLHFSLAPADSLHRLLSQEVDVEVEIAWEPTGHGSIGRISTRISGAPVRVTGVHRVMPTATGCTSTLQLELFSRMPLLGGRLLTIVADHTRTHVSRFLDAVDEALADRPG